MVHHFLDHYRLADSGSMALALDELDAQRERALPLHDDLSRLHDALIEGLRATAEFFQSQQGAATIDLVLLQSSKVVALLVDAALNLARQDGWTLLSSAGNYIKRVDPEQLSDVKQRFGYAGLRSLVIAAEIFEVRSEVAAGGAVQVAYRLRPGAC